MKRIFLNIVLALSLLTATAIEAWAVKAIPTPVSVRQPDGSVIKVMIHGDEYLNWMTSGNRIVAAATAICTTPPLWQTEKRCLAAESPAAALL